MMEIEVRGEGELVLRFIDKTGATLMQERLVVSGSPKMQALRIVDLRLRTLGGMVDVAPVLVSRSNAEQRVSFDGMTPSRFASRRCKEIGCVPATVAAAARGVAPMPDTRDGPTLTIQDPPLARFLKGKLPAAKPKTAL